MRRTGWFSCDDPRVNRLHEAALWGLRSNVCDIPTDCPQRERAGWTGDWQLFLPTAAFLYDVAGFSTKWLRDVAADQWADGTVADMSPCPPAEGEGSPIAWRREFRETQDNLVRGLAFDLVPERPAAADRLVALIRAAGTHLATGFLATPYLLPVLADTGHTDVAYELLFQDTEPSWLTMIDRGATTMWEHWNGVDADGVAHDSLNHYAKGAVVSFLHRYVAGLQPVEPAYRHFRVRPHPGGGLTPAEAVHESPYGRIEVRWEAHPSFVLTVGVPPGCTAEATLPGGTTRRLGPGRHVMTGAGRPVP